MPDLSRIAVFGGLYSNYLALEAALCDAHQRGAEACFCLGDLGGFGPNPGKIYPILDEFGIVTIAGNYDQSLASRRADCGYVPRLHGAIFTAGAAEDLNFLVDTSGTAEIAHRELNGARAIDGGRIVACFKDSRCAILEPTTKAR